MIFDIRPPESVEFSLRWTYALACVVLVISYSKMAPRQETIVSIFTGIISNIIAYIQFNIAMLTYQADYERMRETLVRLLSMPIARNVAVSVLTKRAKHDVETFGLDLNE